MVSLSVRSARSAHTVFQAWQTAKAEKNMNNQTKPLSDEEIQEVLAEIRH